MSANIHADNGWLYYPVVTGARGAILIERAREPVFETRTTEGNTRYFVDFGRGKQEITRDTWKELLTWADRNRKDFPCPTEY